MVSLAYLDSGVCSASCCAFLVGNSNYFIWKEQVVLTFRGLGLEGYLDGSMPVPEKLVLNAHGQFVVNAAYLRYVKQDISLASLLLSTVSPNILPQLVGVDTTSAVWNGVTKLYSKLSTTKLMNLHCRLRSMKKTNQSMRDYTMVIKELCDLLATCGSPISEIDHIAMILNGLSVEYEPTIAAITVCQQHSSISEPWQQEIWGNTTYTQCWFRLYLFSFCNTVGQEESIDPENAQINALTVDGPLHHSKWFPDSGATHHVTGNISALASVKSYVGSGKVHLGDGSPIGIYHIGKQIISSESRNLVLDQTLCVHRITKNLMSVAKFATDNSVYFEFHARSCCIKDECTGSVLLRGILDECLYSFDCKVAGDSVATVANVSTSSDQANVCSACQMGKSHVLHFFPSRTVYSRPFELEEIDVWGPVPMFAALVKNQFSSNILALQTDGVGEFRFLEATTQVLDIQLRKSCPHTSQENGIVERKHRHTVETALALLAHASLPLSYWSNAVLSALYLINRMPIKLLGNISPHQKLYGKCMDEMGRVFVSRSVVFNEHMFPFAKINKASVTRRVQGTQSAPLRVVTNLDTHVPGDTQIENFSRLGIFKPKIYASQCKDLPPAIHVALEDPDWRVAVLAEFNALVNNNTWKLVDLPADRKAIGCKWLFKVKKNADGSVELLKARLVAKGYSHIPGFDFMDTFSPVVDVNNAFLKGELNEDVYMKQIPGFEEASPDGKVLVCKLQKALYGLRQAPRNWFLKLQEFLVGVGFESSHVDYSLFLQTGQGLITYVAIYVDDILVTGKVHRTEQGLFLSERLFLVKLLAKNHLFDINPATAHMATITKLSKFEGQVLSEPQQYRRIVGDFQYACHTRPDIAFSVNKAAQYLHAPRKQRAVSRSIAEAEHRSLADATSEVVWVKSVLPEMTVNLTEAPKVAACEVQVNYVPTDSQVVDVLTKPLAVSRFKGLRNKLCVFDLEEVCRS
ncbi:hypothetical protein F3Y22_tig00008013pilonHSYRG00280 [Hibiscus syriacus]|uniref:Integrase catalytic domain-containing protein n=1 Tax=Hibiscus syriacus TaxID=106335 RepID=A0A6A3C9J0_HIBSY|nr:hypothetical protein F3Y22_tig00008013pilonHSYRG00280 [Hibiscus syriacus]